MDLRNYSRVVFVKDSENIESIGYNPADSVLQVNFKRGGSYVFEGIGPALFGALVSSESVGKYFAAHIRQMKGRKV